MRALIKPLNRHLRRYLPKSLFGRALLIVLVPILLLQGVAAVVTLKRHYDKITEKMAEAVSHELNYAIDRVEEAESVGAARAALAQMSEQFDMEMGLDEGATVETRLLRNFYDVTGGIIHETFKDDVHRPLALDLVSFAEHAHARIVTTKGVLRVLVPRDRLNPTNPHYLLLWTTLTAILLAILAVLFLRNQIRPIRELAGAASAYGRGLSVSFRPSGAIEVRSAGAALPTGMARCLLPLPRTTNSLSSLL